MTYLCVITVSIAFCLLGFHFFNEADALYKKAHEEALRTLYDIDRLKALLAANGIIIDGG